jgi:ATP-dependent Clp protease ATP-binding subunit ClpC
MLERYTQDARRAIFFAYYEAHKRGSSYVGTEHLLMGLLHESRTRTNKLFGLKRHRDDFCKQLKLPDSRRALFSIKKPGDIPLSIPSKRVLFYTAEEALRLNSEPIDTEHLLLGLLREGESDVPGVLASAGIDLESARKRIQEESDFHSTEQAVNERLALTPSKTMMLLALAIVITYLLIELVTTK